MIAPHFAVNRVRLTGDQATADIHRLYQETFAEEYGGYSLPGFKANFNLHAVYKATYRYLTIGMAICAPNNLLSDQPKSVVLDWLAIDNGYRGQGFGSLLLNEVEIDLESKGARLLDVATYDAATIPFYLDNDYVQVSTPYPDEFRFNKVLAS